MSAKIFHTLVDPERARQVLIEKFENLIELRTMQIQNVGGMIAAEDVYSKEDIPPFDRSEVDGFAVDHQSVVGADEDSPKSLEIVGDIEIGKPSNLEIGSGEAAYISTGSVIPRGADSVVMVEHTSKEKEMVKIYKSVNAGENIAHAGSDFFMGEVLVRKGKTITPEMIALLASSGIEKIRVMDRMKVGIISTGNELISPGRPIKVGQIYDSNSYYFKTALEGTGLASCSILGTVRDDEKSMEVFIKSNLDKFKILISSGSTSAGFHDLLYRVIENLGGKIEFHGISIKPGKPTFLASLGSGIIIGMPGFPLSAASVLRYVVVPSLKQAFGLPDEQMSLVKLPFRINSERGKDTVLPAIRGRSGRAYPIFGESGSISRLAYADGFIVLKSERNFYDENDEVPYFPLHHGERDLLFIGSNDPLIERVIFGSSSSPVLINAGSWGGVEAMKMGEADVSGIHLLRRGEYNTFILRDDKKRNYVMVRGFSRTQGFVSRDGISNFSDITKNDLIFVNRNKGSGTRDLIESEIDRELGQKFQKEKIRGYFWEAKSHAAVAKAVQQGRADAGVSIEFYARKLNLSFAKIRDENYDILMGKEFYKSDNGKRFLEMLKRSSKFKKDFPGYKFPENIGEIMNG
ncbi:MAG: molybdopterin biosynthesis protein [Thermoplasmata archaeon]